jgi:hypothetical protein
MSVAEQNFAPSLSTWVQFMRYCPRCEKETIFVAGWECAAGLVGCCLECGDERVAPFTRTTAEAA